MKEKRATGWVVVLAFTLCLLSASAYAKGPDEVTNDVFLHDRLTPDEFSSSFVIPSGSALVITDIVIQNKAGGDVPVSPSQFSRVDLNTVDISSPQNIGDVFFTVVGNDTLSLHFTTGIRVNAPFFRVHNVINSTAPLIEFVVTGFLTKKP